MKQCNKTIKIVIVCMISSVLWLQSALAETPAAQSDGTLELDQVSFQLKWKHQFQFAGFYAALEKGFYRDAGLDVTIIEGGPGIDFIETVVSGQAEYGVEMPDLLLRRAEGQPVVVLACIYQHSPIALMSLAESNIRTPHDLIGRRIMLRPASGADLRAMISHEGIEPGDIEITDHTFDVEDLIAGKTDAMSLYSTAYAGELKSRGVAFNSLSPHHYGVDFYGDCIFTSQDEIDRHPSRVRAFRAASLKGWEYAMNNPKELARLIHEKYSPGKSVEALLTEAGQMAPLLLHKVIEIGHINPGRWKHIADTFVSQGILDPDYSLEGFLYDPSPTPDYTWAKWTIAVIAATLVLAAVSVIILLVFNLRLRKAVSQRTFELSQANKELIWQLTVSEAMSQLSSKLISPTISFKEILKVTLDYAKMLTQSEHGYVGIIETDTKDMVCENLTEMMGKVCQVTGEGLRIRFPIGADGLYPKLWGHALNTLEPFYTNEPPSHPTYGKTPQGHVPLNNFLTIPAIHAGTLVGQVALANSDRGYTDRDLQVTKRLTDLYAMALGRKQAEEDSQAKSQQLEASNQQLRANEEERNQLVKSLESKNKELQSIVYVASHDLSTPLVNIDGFSGELAETCGQLRQMINDSTDDDLKQKLLSLLDDNIPESIKYVKAGTAKIASLLDGLLQVSRVGSTQVDVQSLDMNKVVDDVRQAMEFQISQKDVSFTVGTLPPCKADRTQIDQVFTNLIDNALKYLHPDRKGQIHISGRVEDDLSVYCVHDNGIGMADGHHGNIFDLFHRLSPKDGIKGQGLGLTIVKRILQRHNGGIHLESTPAAGSKFYVTLPSA